MTYPAPLPGGALRMVASTVLVIVPLVAASPGMASARHAPPATRQVIAALPRQVDRLGRGLMDVGLPMRIGSAPAPQVVEVVAEGPAGSLVVAVPGVEVSLDPSGGVRCEAAVEQVSGGEVALHRTARYVAEGAVPAGEDVLVGREFTGDGRGRGGSRWRGCRG